jgi:hypothetical protein
VELCGRCLDAQHRGQSRWEPDAKGDGKVIMSSTTPPCTECLTVASSELAAQVRQLVEVGNVRRVAIQTEHRRTLIEIPGLLGCTGEALEPVWPALSALGQRGPSWTVVVERELGWPTPNGQTRQTVAAER